MKKIISICVLLIATACGTDGVLVGSKWTPGQINLLRQTCEKSKASNSLASGYDCLCITSEVQRLYPDPAANVSFDTQAFNQKIFLTCLR